MAIFYRGAGVGTYWHGHNGCSSGFWPRNSTIPNTPDRIIQHVYNGLTDSPYVSLTLSYGVAFSYALEVGTKQPTASDPAYVYEFEINAAHGVALIDPVKQVAAGAPNPVDANPYQHNGYPYVMLGITWPLMSFLLRTPVPTPPGAATSAAPVARVGPHLWAMVAALRDAEILAVGNIPTGCVIKRHSVC